MLNLNSFKNSTNATNPTNAMNSTTQKDSATPTDLFNVGLTKDMSILSGPFSCSIYRAIALPVLKLAQTETFTPSFSLESSTSSAAFIVDRSKRMMLFRAIDLTSKKIILEIDINTIESRTPLKLAASLLVLSFPGCLLAASLLSSSDVDPFIKSLEACRQGAACLAAETTPFTDVKSADSKSALKSKLNESHEGIGGQGTTKLRGFPWSKMWGASRRTSTTSLTDGRDKKNRRSDVIEETSMPGLPPSSFTVSSPIRGSFRHVTHIGVAEDGSLDIRNLPVEWIKTFKALGVSKRELARDPELGRSLLEAMELHQSEIDSSSNHSNILSSPPPPPPSLLQPPTRSTSSSSSTSLLNTIPMAISKRRPSLPETSLGHEQHSGVVTFAEREGLGGGAGGGAGGGGEDATTWLHRPLPISILKKFDKSENSPHASLPPPSLDSPPISLQQQQQQQQHQQQQQQQQQKQQKSHPSAFVNVDKGAIPPSASKYTDEMSASAGGGRENSEKHLLSKSHLKSSSEPMPSSLLSLPAATPSPRLFLSAIQSFDKRVNLKATEPSAVKTMSSKPSQSTPTHPLQREAPNSNMLEKLRNVIQARRQVTALSTFNGDASDDENDDW
jgi:hypothetical protein